MDDPLADAKASARMTGLVQGIDGKLHSLTALSEGLRVNRQAKGTPDWSGPLGADRVRLLV